MNCRHIRSLVAPFALAASICLSACSQTTAPPVKAVDAAAPAPLPLEQQASTAAPTSPSPPPSTPATPAVAEQVSDDALPEIPKDALYTIHCLNVNTPTHVADARRLKIALSHRTKSHDWYVLHHDSYSSVYFGFYRTFDNDADPSEKARAKADRLYIAGLVDDNGDKPFERCVFEQLNTSDPIAPPEWDLRNQKGFWALQIAAYTGSLERKQAAVEAVREARASGIDNIYFYHGPVISSVVIGTWPREAVKEQDEATARTAEPSKDLLVLPQPLLKGQRTDNVYSADGKKVEVVVPKVEPVDPTLLAAMRRYPLHSVNGEQTRHTVKLDDGSTSQEDDPSFLVYVPHRGDSGDDATASDSTSDAPTSPGNDAGGAVAPPGSESVGLPGVSGDAPRADNGPAPADAAVPDVAPNLPLAR